jgi:dUTP pyrophosphatase
MSELKDDFQGHIGISVCNKSCNELSFRDRGYEKVSNAVIEEWNQNNPSFAFSQEDVVVPERKTIGSAGSDFTSPLSVYINPGKTVMIPTGIKSYMRQNEVLFIDIRSSMGTKNKLKIANCIPLIDSDYYNNPDNEGHILIVIENTGTEIFKIKKGDRIAQGVWINYLLADNDNATMQRISGLGSTGR